MKSIFRIGMAFVVIAIFTGSLFLLRSQDTSVPDFNTLTITNESPEVIIDIARGSSGSEIAQLLYENKVTKSIAAFFRVAVADVRSNKIAPGQHRLTLRISAKQALEQLLDPNRIPNLIKVSEGAWMFEVTQLLLDYGFTKQEIVEAFKQVTLPKGFQEAEGLLFPAQYSFEETVTALQVVQAMVNRFIQDGAGKKILAGTDKFTSVQLLTIASIIQAEGIGSDFGKVSRVIYNRLKLGMPLQMDSTVHFVQKARGNIFLSSKSTLINSPYNTYKKYGLPPGPIGSPSSLAMQAALSPDQGDWLYFITVAPQDTRFTSSFEEFSVWKKLYIKNRKSGAFK